MSQPTSHSPRQAPRRKSLSKKVRFAVLSRDQFTCQYCGRKAPDVLLHVDHLDAVASGGTNDLLNLVTSCEDCNFGKGAEKLASNSLIEKQRRQLEQLAERREQLQMMFEWQQSLAQMSEDTVAQLAEYWSGMVKPFQLTTNGIKQLKRYIRRHGLAAVMEAMRVGVDEYVEHDAEGQPTTDSVNLAWRKVGGICSVREAEKDKPYLKKLLYIRGILRNRLSYCNEALALQLLERCAQAGFDLDGLMAHAKSVRNWTNWRGDIEDWLSAPEDTPEAQPPPTALRAPEPASPTAPEHDPGRFAEENHYSEVLYDDIAGVSIQELGQGAVLACDWDTLDIGGHQVPVTLWIERQDNAATLTVDLHWFAGGRGASPETIRQLLARPYHYLSRRHDFQVTHYADHLTLGGWATLKYSETTRGKDLGGDSESIRGFHEMLLVGALESSKWPPPLPLYCPSVEVQISPSDLSSQRLDSFEVYTHIVISDEVRLVAPKFSLILTGDPALPVVAWWETEIAAYPDEGALVVDRGADWLRHMAPLQKHTGLLVLPPAYDDKRIRCGSLLALSESRLDLAYETARVVFHEQETATAEVLYPWLADS